MRTYTGKEKKDSRADLIALYREMVAPRLPEGRQYWTLCNTQPKKNSELVQLVDSGLITASQFHGVDDEIKLIEQNRKWWPEAHFYCGDLFRCVLSADNFDPGLFFYDSTNTPAFDELYRNLAFIMSRCRTGTMVCANVMLNDAHPPWKKYDEYLFLERLADQLMSDWDNWKHGMQWGKYRQKGARANMAMYAFVSR